MKGWSRRSQWSSGFPPSVKPLEVDGGLKARSKRGAIAQTWWSGRFITVLESLVVGGRLQRGRTYARKGQVISLDVGPGLVAASVQGSRPRPYKVRIGLTAYGKRDWARLEEALASNAWYLAKLLAGEMPDDIEQLFAELKLPLFPTSINELSLDCSCPDFAVPCKHLAAVFYLLAESFDDDPFTILAWRGRERDELLANLDAARGSAPVAADAATVHGTPLDECLDGFFALQAALPTSRGRVTTPGALLDQLPPSMITVRERDVVGLLRHAYRSLSGEQ